jgi:hypothetical protein
LKNWYPEVYKRRDWSCYYTPEHEVLTVYEEDHKFRMYQVTSTRAIHMGGIIAEESIAEGPTFNGDGMPSDTEGHRCLIPTMVGSKAEEQQPVADSFEEYMHNIPEWEKEVIGDNTPEDGGLETLLALLATDNEHATIFGASDGGLRKRRREYGSQGWLIAAHNAKVLWRGSGPAPGSPNSSYRAEGYGMLGFLRMLFHIMTYYKVQMTDSTRRQILFFTDSQSLINKQIQLHTYEDWYAAIHTWPHADVLMQLRSAEADIYPFVLKLRHVKSHQDDEKDYEDLEDDAKMNYMCDILATEKLDTLERQNKKQKVRPLPACPVYLNEATGVINAKEQLRLKQALPRQELKAYYRKRYNWQQSTFDNINWNDFARARKRNITTKRYVTTLCCCWLPTNHRMQWTTGRSNTCGICGDDKTSDHMFECNGCSAWRTALYKDFFKMLKSHETDPMLIATLLQGLRWHYEGHDPTIDISNDHQNKIGWNHILRGWLNTQWQKQQEKYLRETFPDNTSKRDQGKNWSLFIIEWVWKQGHTLWKTRCDMTHEKTGRAETAQQRSYAEAKVTALYQQAEDVGYYDRHKMFSKSLDDKLREPAKRLIRWVELTTPAVKQAVREFSQRTRKQAQDIRKFFPFQGQQVARATQWGIDNDNRDNDYTTTTTNVTSEDNNAPT